MLTGLSALAQITSQSGNTDSNSGCSLQIWVSRYLWHGDGGGGGGGGSGVHVQAVEVC